jgi:DNA polymerase I-like protein with 3'-5' exonuclease and polymerase domains
MLELFNEQTGITEVLVDARNFNNIIPQLITQIQQSTSPYVGFDIETEDSGRHAGLNKFMAMKKGDQKYKKAKKLVFDLNRTVITGFSIYLDNDSRDYYFNMAHADVENRLEWQTVLPLLGTIKATKTWVIHNAAFELAQCNGTWKFDLGHNYICTMQLCVSAYNSDEYDIQKFHEAGLGGIAKLIPEITKTFAGYEPRQRMTTQQNELLQRCVPKQSAPEHSYNGWVRELSYGYGLKKAVKSWFGYEQQEFETVLQGRAHMGLLTGEEVLHYGADDAYWCLKLMHRVIAFMQETNPQVINTFFEQENPMPRIWADNWLRGIRLNYEQLEYRRTEARNNFANILRDFIKALQQIAFADKPAERLVQKQMKWYIGKDEDQPKYLEYRERYQAIASVDADSLSDYDVCQLVSGSVPENWATERGEKVNKNKGNITHYMMARVLFHDLLDLPLIYVKGAIQSGGDARGKLKEKIELLSTEPKEWLKEWGRYKCHTELSDQERQALAEKKVAEYPRQAAETILNCLGKMATVEQVMKLYLNSYLMLVDPETKRIYPTISSRLNTRRMGCENPNGMQLSKRGETTYVRGFFLPERDDHLIVSVDWSQVELVLIGEDSKDPTFGKAYGQIPYDDLHLDAAASAVRVFHPDFTNLHLKELPKMVEADITSFSIEFPQVLMNPVKKETMTPKAAHKFWRGTAGKVSNFGYWYSGSLMTVQPGLGWTDKQMWDATDNYRKQFPVAEAWRIRTQNEAKMYGCVYILDGHRRTRYESTQYWYNAMVAKFASYGNAAVTAFGQRVCSTIQRRAANQSVNAKIQGGCATLAKRSILRLVRCIKSEGWDAVFYMPIHDELVFSVRWDQAIAFSKRVKEIMCHHPDLVQWLKLDGTVSVGKTLEPYDKDKAPLGQIELDEAPLLPEYLPKDTEGKVLSDNQRMNVVNYLMGLTPMTDAA